ncbi:MAG: hypothetical protein LUD47_00510 [Clostridia bacterium]|nr:hypothetical protein [Clostridia bacterium]
MTDIKNFTCVDKDFFGADDFAVMLGMSHDEGAKIIRQIKAVSDIFGITGRVHRADYQKYVETQLCADVHSKIYNKR